MKSYNVYITNLLNYQNLMFTLNNHHSASGKMENHDESDFIVSWPVMAGTHMHRAINTKTKHHAG